MACYFGRQEVVEYLHTVARMDLTAVLASPKEAAVSLRLIDELPPPDDTTLWCINTSKTNYANARCMMGEVLEQEGRFSEAVEWARAEIQVRQRGRHLALSVPSAE